MKRNMFKAILVAVMVLSLSTFCFAVQTKNITITASIPQLSQSLDVVVSRVRASDDVWLTSGDIPIGFGSLFYDTTYNIFRSTYYYAVDIGVNDNSGTNWLITHTRTNLAKDATNNLNNNVNVSFVKQLDDTNDVPLQKVSYQNSNSVSYNKSSLSGGWLRIYYGIATGLEAEDATGVEVITTAKPYGTYTGQVTITLTP